MESSGETTSADSGAEATLAGDEFPWEEFPEVEQLFFGNIKQYVEQNLESTETQLFSFLALMNSYCPKSFLLKSECQTVLGPPDPIHGGSTFEERMEPFAAVIETSISDPEHVRIDLLFARKALAVLTDLEIKRSSTVMELILHLCGNQAQEIMVQFIKDLLTKREMGANDELKTFSRLIKDICNVEDWSDAISVLETASNEMRQHFIFPQTLARLHYIELKDYETAETWAKIAIERAPSNSYVADTLGHVYKNWLWNSGQREMARKAFRAFKDVEEKAEAEVRKEMKDEASFNNRGHFGFMQVAKMTFEKIRRAGSPLQRHVQFHKLEVEEKFSFFEWYLTYSMPSKLSLEPPYFWKSVALCYQYYTWKRASDSTSFPGLLDYLNHGQFMSRGSRAGLKEEKEKTVSDLEGVCQCWKWNFRVNGDVEAAQRYILSNIILSNKMHNSSPKVAPVRELQKILHKFLGTNVKHRSPEFNILVLMLFWPEDHKRVKDEVKLRKPAPTLPEHVAFMEQVFESSRYAKYLRGRYLVPLFFLGKGSGLNKWIHKSTLDAIVEERVDAERANNPDGNSKKKWKQILDYWSNGKVWQSPEIQDILLPVEIEPMTLRGQGEQKRVVRVGGLKIPATAEFKSDDLALGFYLGLTIKGPVVFKGKNPGQ